MPEEDNIQQRKADHITINLKKDVESALTTGLEAFHFRHNALPDIDLKDVDCTTEIFGRKLGLPLLISSMTGGTVQARQINQGLAEAAQRYRLAMGVGSQRVAIEHPELADTFKVREIAPDILLLANLGAIQLNYTYTVEHCQAAVDTLEADVLILHLNALQEALMEDGNMDFKGLLKKIEQVCKRLPVPVVAKEVGWGISGDVARRLVDVGVQGIDVAGAGGTSWSEVERHRNPSEVGRQTAAAFKGWGIPTAQALQEVHAALPDTKLIASGGIRDGVEGAKCLALGADLVGMARPFLQAVSDSPQALDERIAVFGRQLRVSMFAVGAATLNDLTPDKLLG
ncbi:MAG: isopentenyl-diphosphate Delta-isomerase [Chloroflexota bacterium]|nr:isopentenyl-diphosphate Delta-isomerase [Chloroflexota bacterium]